MAMRPSYMWRPCVSPDLLLGLHCIMGAIASLVARRKGLNFRLWLILRLIGSTAALVAALITKPNDQNPVF